MSTATITPSSLRRTARRGRTLSQCKPNNKVLSLHKLHDTPLCSLLRVLSAPLTLHLHYAQPRHYRTSPTFILFARFEKSSQRESGAVAAVKIHEWIFDLHDSDFTAQSVGRSAYSAMVGGLVRKRAIGRWGGFTDGSRWNTSPAPLIWLLHSLLAFLVLYKLKNFVMPT